MTPPPGRGVEMKMETKIMGYDDLEHGDLYFLQHEYINLAHAPIYIKGLSGEESCHYREQVQRITFKEGES